MEDQHLGVILRTTPIVLLILLTELTVLLFTLSTLFPEPRGGKAQATRREADSRSKTATGLFSPDAAAVAADTLYLSYCGWPNGHSHDAEVISSVQFSLLVGVWFCDPKDCSMSGLPVRHQFLEFTQIHVHWVGDAFQPSHPLSSPSPPTFHLSQHQGLFQWVSSSHQVAKVLEQH